MDDNIDIHTTSIDQEAPPIDTFPGESEFVIKKHCGCQMTYYPKIRTYFWGEWEFQPCMPVFVISLTILSYLFLIIGFLPHFTLYDFLIIFPIATVFMGMFIFSYIQTIRTGPGYFPFYWSIRNDIETSKGDNGNNMFEENANLFLLEDKNFPAGGIMTSDEQYQWAHKQSRPLRCVLARSARRIVLRPDHLCGWTTVWIGKRNHKMFIQFNLYGTLYLGIFVIYAWRLFLSVLGAFGGDPVHIPLPVIIASGVLGLFAVSFVMLTASFLSTGFYSTCVNKTSWESWNESPISYRRGLRENFEDVFGSLSLKSIFWPTDSFAGISNDELQRRYETFQNE